MVAAIGRVAPKKRAGRSQWFVSSSMTAAALVQQPAPLLIGERLNTQGSRKMKRLALETIRRDDPDRARTGGRRRARARRALALTERTDEAAMMRTLVKKLSLSVEAPLCIDSTEANVIEAALQACPGSAIINSINLENGLERIQTVMPLVMKYGASVIALTIDETGMAKAAERKLEVARRIHDLCTKEYGLPPERLIFDDLTFTLATGEAEFLNSAVETIEGIKLIKRELPGVLTSLGVSNVSFGLGKEARAVLNSVMLYHRVQAGLDAAIVNPATSFRTRNCRRRTASSPTTSCSTATRQALANPISHFEAARRRAQPRGRVRRSGDERRRAAALPDPAPQARGHRGAGGRGGQAPARRGRAQQRAASGDEGSRRQVRLGRADPAVRAAERRGDEEVGRAARELPREEGGLEQGRVVLATVFGDVHDIGKNLGKRS